jgi:hypothetical protein
MRQLHTVNIKKAFRAGLSIQTNNLTVSATSSTQGTLGTSSTQGTFLH